MDWFPSRFGFVVTRLIYLLVVMMFLVYVPYFITFSLYIWYPNLIYIHISQKLPNDITRLNHNNSTPCQIRTHSNKSEPRIRQIKVSFKIIEATNKTTNLTGKLVLFYSQTANLIGLITYWESGRII